MTTTSPAQSQARIVAHDNRPKGRIHYGVAIRSVLIATFSLSVVHTIYASLADLEDPEFNVNTPLAWVFYIVAFSIAALARADARPAQYVVTGYLVAILGIAIFYYPTTFTAEQQTTFGWFENDVYVGLLITALYLSIVRLARRALVP